MLRAASRPRQSGMCKYTHVGAANETYHCNQLAGKSAVMDEEGWNMVEKWITGMGSAKGWRWGRRSARHECFQVRDEQRIVVTEHRFKRE